MGLIRYGKSAAIGVYPGNQSGNMISYRSGLLSFDEDLTVGWEFADNKSLTDVKTGLTLDFTRASTATYYDSAKVLQTAAVNEARFDHDPVTGKSLGLLIEEARTNLFLNSDAPVTQGITTTAQSYTISVWGSGDITVSGSATGTATEGNPLTVTAAAGTLTCTVNGSLDRAQVEAGAFPTSYIPTAGASVTRAVDVASASITLPAGEAHTMYASFRKSFAEPVANKYLAIFRRAAGAEYLRFRETTAFRQYGDYRDAAAASLQTVSYGGAGDHEGAFAVEPGSQNQAYNGQLSAGRTDDATFIPDGSILDQVIVGSNPAGSNVWNGHIARLAYFNVRQDDQWLGGVTAGAIDAFTGKPT